jgi:UDP-N-acetyl-D-mannosaminuronic acid dehydrogenase
MRGHHRAHRRNVQADRKRLRDVNIAFANELSIICDKLDISVWELIRLANRHPRVNILQPGPGVGGHCIAVDPWFIVNRNPDEARLIHAARQVNDSKPHWVVDKVLAAARRGRAQGLRPEDVRVAAFGLAFKPDIDDLRESPAVDIVKELPPFHPADAGRGTEYRRCPAGPGGMRR